MNKKKIGIIAIILFLGLGTFVFANPNEEYLELEEEVENRYIPEEGKTISENETKEGLTENSSTDLTQDIWKQQNNAKGIQNFVYQNVTIPPVADMITGNENSQNPDSGNITHPDTPGKPGESTDPDNNNENQPDKPETPDKPDKPGGSTDPDSPDEKDPYADIRKLVETLQEKVNAAKSRDEILEAREYRDKQNINALVENIDDSKVKLELKSKLDNLNIILDDNKKPILTGVANNAIVNYDVILTIEEENLKEIQVNGKTVSLEKTLSFQTEGKYEVTVVDCAYQKATLVFTIDKTAPLVTVKSSNNGEKTNQDVTIFITANEKLQPVSGWKLSDNGLELSKVFAANTTGELEIKDLAGNAVKANYEVFDISKEIPAIVENGITYSTRELTNGDVEVIITTNKSIFAPSGWQMVQNSTVFRKVYKKNTIEKVKLTDAYQNTGYITIEINNIDKTPPKAIFMVSPMQKTNKDVLGKIIADEEIKVIGNEDWNYNTTKTEITKLFTENGEETVTIEDLAGNQIEVECIVSNIDREVSGIKITTSNADHIKTNKDVIVTISADEELEDLKNGWTLSNDQKSISKVFTENTKATVKVQDKLGNIAEVEYEVFDINKENPEISDIKYSLTEDGKVKVTITTNRSVFLPRGWTLVGNSKIFSKIYEESMMDTVRLKDGYGNRVNIMIDIDIDKIKSELNGGITSRDKTEIPDALTSVVLSVAKTIQTVII